MKNKFYAVIDTNVIVSALISRYPDSNPVKVIRAITQEIIIPLFNDDILSEYRNVLSRSKFGLDGKMEGGTGSVGPAVIDTILLAERIADNSKKALPLLQQGFPSGLRPSVNPCQ